MILEIELVPDAKLPPGTTGKQKAINTRFIAELDPIYQPAGPDDDTPIQIGTEITMHSGKKHRTTKSLRQILGQIGGRA